MTLISCGKSFGSVMSHCTSFAFSYKDEELAVKSFHRLGLEPTMDVVAEYGSNFSKFFLSAIGYAGRRQFRAIVAESQGYQYFLCREGPEYKMRLEKDEEISDEDEIIMSRMETEFRLTYIYLAMERLAERFENGGTPTRLVRQDEAITLQFGPSFDRSIRIAVSADNLIEEDVTGVSGPSCADLTSELEELLSLETAELATQWKPEYRQAIDDQVVQVLRLR